MSDTNVDTAQIRAALQAAFRIDGCAVLNDLRTHYLDTAVHGGSDYRLKMIAQIARHLYGCTHCQERGWLAR